MFQIKKQNKRKGFSLLAFVITFSAVLSFFAMNDASEQYSAERALETADRHFQEYFKKISCENLESLARELYESPSQDLCSKTL